MKFSKNKWAWVRTWKSEWHTYRQWNISHESEVFFLNWKYMFGNSIKINSKLTRRMMIQLRMPLYPVKLLLELSKESWTRWQLDKDTCFSHHHAWGLFFTSFWVTCQFSCDCIFNHLWLIIVIITCRRYYTCYMLSVEVSVLVLPAYSHPSPSSYYLWSAILVDSQILPWQNKSLTYSLEFPGEYKNKYNLHRMQQCCGHGCQTELEHFSVSLCASASSETWCLTVFIS